MNGIFHDGLQNQLRHPASARLGICLENHPETLLKACFLQLHIGAYVLQFRLQRDLFLKIGQRTPEVGTQRLKQFPRLVRFLPAEKGNGVQRIEQKMRIDLRLQSPQFCLPQFCLMLFQSPYLELGTQKLCQTGGKFRIRPFRITVPAENHQQPDGRRIIQLYRRRKTPVFFSFSAPGFPQPFVKTAAFGQKSSFCRNCTGLTALFIHDSIHHAFRCLLGYAVFFQIRHTVLRDADRLGHLCCCLQIFIFICGLENTEEQGHPDRVREQHGNHHRIRNMQCFLQRMHQQKNQQVMDGTGSKSYREQKHIGIPVLSGSCGADGASDDSMDHRCRHTCRRAGSGGKNQKTVQGCNSRRHCSGNRTAQKAGRQNSDHSCIGNCTGHLHADIIRQHAEGPENSPQKKAAPPCAAFIILFKQKPAEEGPLCQKCRNHRQNGYIHTQAEDHFRNHPFPPCLSWVFQVRTAREPELTITSQDRS